MSSILSVFKKGNSHVVDECQLCSNPRLESLIFLGFLPPVNKMRKVHEMPSEEQSYPAQLLLCSNCNLVQLGLTVDPTILFPPEYPYTSGTTKVLRENFSELYQECSKLIEIKSEDLVIDIGSNDGTLLSNFKNKNKILGITPEDIGRLAIQSGIPTIQDYFTRDVVNKVKNEYGLAKIITATNVFAHIEDVNKVTDLIIDLLEEDGVFISESHYLYRLIKTVQYDTIYHEHLRYYSLTSLKYLFEKHNLEIFHAKEIPSHGGSIRVYVARKGKYKIKETVNEILEQEKKFLNDITYNEFKDNVVLSKIRLYSLLKDIKENKQKIYGIGAPSRASTLINYVGLDDGIIDAVMEVNGSHKIGKYIPGTLIPILEESKLFEDQPDYALLFSWHIAEELVPKLKEKGFKGKFIVPLPIPIILD